MKMSEKHRLVAVLGWTMAAAMLMLSGWTGTANAQDGVIRVGLVGLDTSHVIAFTNILNDPEHESFIPEAKVVAGFKGGSPDIESSHTRVDGYTQQLEEDFGIEIVDTIEELCTKVDAIMLESVDGRPHLEQARPVIEAGLPLFIDKPIAGSLADAIEIFRLAKEHDVPCFSSSSLRYYPSLEDLLAEDVGELRGAIAYGPCHLEPHHPDLFWYGIHTAETLYTIMGTGCQSVVRTHTENTDVVTGVWEGGRVGTFRGIRNASSPYRAIVFGTEKVAYQDQRGHTYVPLVEKVVEFFQNGEPPVSPKETIELFAFMEAADESKRQGGAPVKIADVLEKHSGGEPLPY